MRGEGFSSNRDLGKLEKSEYSLEKVKMGASFWGICPHLSCKRRLLGQRLGLGKR